MILSCEQRRGSVFVLTGAQLPDWFTLRRIARGHLAPNQPSCSASEPSASRKQEAAKALCGCVNKAPPCVSLCMVSRDGSGSMSRPCWFHLSGLISWGANARPRQPKSINRFSHLPQTLLTRSNYTRETTNRWVMPPRAPPPRATPPRATPHLSDAPAALPHKSKQVETR